MHDVASPAGNAASQRSRSMLRYGAGSGCTGH
jgi:hypothetical protein